MTNRKFRFPRRDALKALTALPVAAFASRLSLASTRARLYFSCSPENDLYRVLGASGVSRARYATPGEAVNQAPRGSGVLVLAEGYPAKTTQLERSVFDEAARKSLRLYVEFPASVPGVNLGKPDRAPLGKNHNLLDRVVVASGMFAPALNKMRVLAIHDCAYVPSTAGNAALVLARVAGFDRAVFGLPQQGVQPVLFEHPAEHILIATTKLSNFITGRYAPSEAWQRVWQWILAWLAPGDEILVPRWTPSVHPSYSRHAGLPESAELNAFQRGVAWYAKARLFVAPSWQPLAQKYASSPHPGPRASWPAGDGSEGILEGFSSNIQWDGTQPVGWHLRSDCAAETSMAMAFSGSIENKVENSKIAANLTDFICFKSSLGMGPRSDPHSPSFGLLGWSLPTAAGIYYGDDNARTMLGIMAAAAMLKSNRWDKRLLACLLANLRTSGKLGFRRNALTEQQLQHLGWRHFYEEETVNYHPHYEAYLWACFLRAYDKTHYAPFLERARNAIQMTVAAYPAQWQWSNGFQQERARMLLALAWLIRVNDTAEHRQWLKHLAGDLLRLQDSSGAIREELGPVGKSRYGPPMSNGQYGTAEAPLIQRNGDPACDLLYTCNFAILGLHEAAAATGDPFYREAENKLANFLCRVQIHSDVHPELDSGWYRAFDFDRWDYWASNSDWGWGAWSIETGWTQSWICAVLAMRHMSVSLWELTHQCEIGAHLQTLLPVMLGD